MDFKDNLSKLRKQNGMSQEDLAEKLGISRQAISKWESGYSYPDLETVIKLSEIFNVSTDELLKDSKEEKNEQASPRITYKKIAYISTLTFLALMFICGIVMQIVQLCVSHITFEPFVVNFSFGLIVVSTALIIVLLVIGFFSKNNK